MTSMDFVRADIEREGFEFWHPKFDPDRGGNFFVPGRIIDELKSVGFSLKGNGGQSTLGHSLQTASLAERDGHDDEYVICALLHDIAQNFAPNWSHADIGAELLKPYVSEANYWMVKHHNIFVGYSTWDKVGRDKNARDQFKDSPYYERTVEFVTNYDNVAHDPEFRSEPIEHFESRIRDIFGRLPKAEKVPYATDLELLRAKGFAS